MSEPREAGDTPPTAGARAGKAAGGGKTAKATAAAKAGRAGSGAKGAKAAGTKGAKAGTAKGKAAAAKGKGPTTGAGAPGGPRWAALAAVVILGALAVRLAILAADLVPVHFDEGQYWAYGQELAWGYFSKPPGVAALIEATTELFGDTAFGLRVSSPVMHAVIAWMIFQVGRRLLDARTGFWAAAGYTAAPGVTVSAMLVTTDPPMMAAGAVALYAMVRAGSAEGRAALGWWALMGAMIGLGFLAKYTALAFAGGAIGYGLFSARGRDWRGAGVALGVGTAVAAPNLLWNWANDFPTIRHVAEDAAPSGGATVELADMAEFLGAQLGVIGPVFFLAVVASLAGMGRLRADPGLRLLAWMTAPLLLGITALALATRAQPNWAAPAYVAGSLLAAHWLLARDWRRALGWGQAGLGAAAAVAIWGLGWLYAADPQGLPRAADPFKKMRIGPALCERAFAAMAEEGAEVLLSDSRRRLSECMFIGTLGWDRVAVWNPDRLVDNHHEMVATLQPGDTRPMLLMVLGDGAGIAEHFAEARRIETGRFATHADRDYAYALWAVRDFEGYGRSY